MPAPAIAAPRFCRGRRVVAELEAELLQRFEQHPAEEMQLLDIAGRAHVGSKLCDLRHAADHLVEEGQLCLCRHGGGRFSKPGHDEQDEARAQPGGSLRPTAWREAGPGDRAVSRPTHDPIDPYLQCQCVSRRRFLTGPAAPPRPGEARIALGGQGFAHSRGHVASAQVDCAARGAP